MNTCHGSCHCGRVKFIATATIDKSVDELHNVKPRNGRSGAPTFFGSLYELIKVVKQVKAESNHEQRLFIS